MAPLPQTSQVPPFVLKILGPLEILAISGAFAGVALKYSGLPGGDEVLMLSLSSLSAVYFLTAFKPPAETSSTERPQGFVDLLVRTIMPKATWIACSVAVIGVLFAILHLHGAREQLMVGCAALASSVVISLYFIATGSDDTSGLVKILYRAAPILVMALYMFMNLPPK